MGMTICEVMWLQQLLKDLVLHLLGSTSLLCHNQAALAIDANLVQHERTKHAETDCHFIREKVKDGTVSPNYIKNADQVADIFTKILSIEQQHKLLSKLGVHPSSHLQGEY